MKTTQNIICLATIFFSLNCFSQFRLEGVPSGDCNKKELTLVDRNDNPYTIILNDANNKDRLCKWIDWTANKRKITKQVMLFIGLKSTTSKYALLSFEGDCNKRTFRIYNKSANEIFEKSIENNCEIIDFNKNPAEIINTICKKYKCEESD